MNHATPSRRAIEPVSPHVSKRVAFGLLLVFLAVSLAQGFGRHAVIHEVGSSLLLSRVLLQQTLGALGAWLALPVVSRAVTHAGDGSRGWTRFALTHVVGYLGYSTLQTVAMLVLDQLISPWLGRSFSLARIASITRDEFRGNLLLYPALSGLWTVVLVQAQRALRRERDAKREAQVVHHRLLALTARLEPHFLFNTLHAVSELMYEDLPRTETLLADLAALLRVSLEASDAQWSLGEELEYTQRYHRILQVRFEDRIQLRVDIAERFQAVLVPRFVLQTLVENAVKHNAVSDQPIEIKLHAHEESSTLVLSIVDNGQGFSSTRSPLRGSLARMAETLSLLHADRACLEVGPQTGAGATVRVEVPIS